MKINKHFSSALIAGSLLIGELMLVQYRNVLLASPSPVQPRSGAANKESDQSHNEELPRVVFLNQSAVLIASKKQKEKYKEHQMKLIEMMNKGVTVLVCPDCMKQYGVKASDLIDGVQVGKPGQTHES